MDLTWWVVCFFSFKGARLFLNERSENDLREITNVLH